MCTSRNEKQETSSAIIGSTIVAHTYDTSTVCRRVADLASREDGKLTLDTRRSLRRRSYKVQGANTLAIQSGVLSETLK